MNQNTDIFKILIVDDISKNIQMIANILKAEGYQMAFAQNGQSALEHAESVSFDLILLDIMMPGMDGYEICVKLKKDIRTRDIPVIFLTARTDTESILKGFETGAVDYVTKPFNSAELLARVRTHLELKRARDIQDTLITEKETLILKLEKALEEIKTLRGFIPICCSCKKIRNDEDYWEQIEVYIQKHTNAVFSHGLCPDCAQKLYPELYEKIKRREGQEARGER